MSTKEELVAIGLIDKVAEEAVANKNLHASLTDVLTIAKAHKPAAGVWSCDRSAGTLLYQLATKTRPEQEERKALVELIVDGVVASQISVDEAVSYLKKKTGKNFNIEEMKKVCGAGLVVSEKEISDTVSKIISDNKSALLEDRYSLKGKLLGRLTKDLKWADGKLRMDEFDKQLLALLGPQTEDDLKPKKKEAKKVSAVKETVDKKDGDAAVVPVFETATEDELDQGRHIPAAQNTEEQLKRHLDFTKGCIYTRFPPEPNGYLHLGHCKAMQFSFGVATARGGKCYMRFDDTNPASEEQKYIDSILDNVEWLGHKPWKITYSSDYFQELYDLAVKMIKDGNAYVCHQTGAEIKKCRETHTDSPWRSRSIEENLKLFNDMRKGKFEEGKICLRMKGDMKHPNPQMWDMVAYRISYIAHPHSGDKWCIYPTYDYTHCIVDSLENIDYSLCTLEFEIRRESYFWLLDILDLYKPKVWEYSRLSVTYNVMSKRKLLTLVNTGICKGWDDPRLLTVNGLRRRGYSAAVLNNFCKLIGVTRNANTIGMELLEYCAREAYADKPRRFVVSDPVKIVLTNVPKDFKETVTAPNHPKLDAMGNRAMTLTQCVYIERSDFKTTDEKGFFGLAPGKQVILRYSYNITCDSFTKNADGSVKEILCTLHKGSDPLAGKKVKGVIHWTSAPADESASTSSASTSTAVKVELRLYEYLFKSKDPMSVPNWLDDINPDSLKTVIGYGEPSLAEEHDKFDLKNPRIYQFERLGYFVLDPDTTKNTLVFNRIVSLKAGAAVSAVKESKTVAVKVEAKANAKTENKPAPKSNFQPLNNTKIDAEIAAQGEVVRQLKADKASKEAIDAAVAKLLDLKKQSGPVAKDAKKGKEVVAKKGNAQHQAAAKQKEQQTAMSPEEKEAAKKKIMEEKAVKAAFKEGGKKGQDLEGMADLGGVKYFHVAMQDCQGRHDLMRQCMAGANVEVDPEGEERKGGAGNLAKCFLSASDDQLVIHIHVPAELAKEKISAKAWYDNIKQHMGEHKVVVETDTTMEIECVANPDKGVFPLKVRDEVINQGFAFLVSKQLVPDQDSSDDECYLPDDW